MKGAPNPVAAGQQITYSLDYVNQGPDFDRDAVMVWPNEARRMLGEAGFEILRTDFAFIFPGFLRLLRGLERRLCRIALGAQYMVLARKR